MKTSDISVEYVDHMGSDLSVVNAARVSFAKESDWLTYEKVTEDDKIEIHRALREGDVKLIKYLAKHKHYSPFNHTFLTVRIKAPIFVARQLVKHEYMSWNEVSRRYVDDEPEFYMPEYWRAKADSVKQGSSSDRAEKMYEDDFTGMTAHDWAVVALKGCISTYNAMLADGVCPEQARMVLPQNMMTEWIWSGTLKAFHKMLSLRLDTHTQYETRLVAEKILPIIYEHFPISIEALLNESK